MKLNVDQIEELIFFKELARNNRLDQLILDEEQPYPLPQYTINEIYSSQYATAIHTIKQEGLINQTLQKKEKQTKKQEFQNNSSVNRKKKAHPTHHPSIKYPLPLAFAYFHSYHQEKLYDKSILVIKNHLQRKNAINPHIINYNLSFLYREIQDSKKAIFCLQSTLKDKPFFEYAVYDYAFLLGINNRTGQALQILKRHLMAPLNNSQSLSPLAQSRFVQSMLINLTFKSKLLSQKQILRVFNGKSLKVQTIFNLGVYLKRIKNFEKAENIFKQIIQSLDEGFQNNMAMNSSFHFKDLDQKIYFYSKVNLSQIYQRMAEDCSQQQQPNKLKKEQSKVYKYKSFQILNSLLKNDEQSIKKTQRMYFKYNGEIKNKLEQLNNDICSESNNYCFHFNQSQLLKSNRKLQSKRQINEPELKKINLSQDKQNISTKSTRNRTKYLPYFKNNPTNQHQKHEIELMKQFNKKFQQRRLQNQKKLKFLLLKDKQLDNFFNTLPKINLQKSSNILNSPEYENSILSINTNNVWLKEMNTSNLINKNIAKNYPQNTTLINKLRKQLQEDNILLTYEQQFQRKKLKYEQQFQGYNLDEALEKVMDKIFQEDNFKPQKQQDKNQNNEKKKSFQKETEYYTQRKNQKRSIKINLIKQNHLKKVTPSENQKNQTFVSTKKLTTQKKIIQNTVSRKDLKQLQKIQIESQSKLLKSTAQKKIIQNTVSRKNLKQLQKIQIESQNKFLTADLKKEQIQENQKKQDLNQRIIQKQNEGSLANFRIKPTTNIQTNDKLVKNITKNKIQSKSTKNLDLTKNQHYINEPNAPAQEFKQAELKDQIEQKCEYEVQDLFKNQYQQSQKTIRSNKIFIKKEKNNIEDIFQSFNPKSTRNIMIIQNAPTSRDHSRKTSIKKSENKGNTNEDQFEQQIPFQFSRRYDEAARLQSIGKYLEAFDIYTDLYKKFKQDNLKQLTLLGLAYNFELQTQFDQAQKTYLKCSKYNNSQAFMKLGQLLIRRNRIESGIQNLQKANCIKRFDKQIQTKLVYGYSLKQQTVQKALSLANSILKRDPMSLEILIMTANILQKQQKIKQALDICLAIDSHKESQFIKHYIGILYLNDGDVVEAFKYFKNALQIKSNHVPSLIEIGTILSELKPKQAMSILNKALQIEPNNRLALTRLAKIYQSIQQNPERAMQIYRKTLQTKSNYEAYMKIGNCLQANGGYLQALVNYRQALNLKKSHEAYMKIAQMHELKKQYKKSIENYQLALEIIPQQHKYYQQKKKIMINMAKNMLTLQQFDGAIQTLQSLLETEESKQIYSMLGQGYFGKQQFSVALQFYEKANNIEPDKQDIQILQHLALCFDKKQQFTASKQIYEKILELDPRNVKCMNNFANILLIIGNTNQAFYWYEVMLQYCSKNIEKRLKVADIYSAVGDWSKVQYHLLICYKQKQHDIKVLQRLINLYKEKRETKLVAKYEKKLTLLKAHNKKKEH